MNIDNITKAMSFDCVKKMCRLVLRDDTGIMNQETRSVILQKTGYCVVYDDGDPDLLRCYLGFIKLAEKSVAGELVHYSNVKGDIRY